jgi:hypothetical protein
MNEKRRCTVRTGGQVWHVIAGSPKEAAVKAFRKRAPKSCGLLTEIEGFGSKDEGPHYMSTVALLMAAGYEVQAS